MTPDILAAISGVGVVRIDSLGTFQTLYKCPDQRLYGVHYDWNHDHLYVAHHDRILSIKDGVVDRVIADVDGACFHSLERVSDYLYAPCSNRDIVYIFGDNTYPDQFLTMPLDDFFDRPNKYKWAEESASDWCHMNFIFPDIHYEYISLYRHPRAFVDGSKGGALLVYDLDSDAVFMLDSRNNYDIVQPHCFRPFGDKYIVANTGLGRVDVINNLSNLIDLSARGITEAHVDYKTLVTFDHVKPGQQIKHVKGPHHIDVWGDYFAVSIPNIGQIQYFDANGDLIHTYKIPHWSEKIGHDPRCYHFQIIKG